MHAVLKTGGKQYRVTKNDIISVDRIKGDPGAKVVFNEILMIDDKIGTPFVSGAQVGGEIVEQTRDKKIIVFKKKRRKDYKRTLGHRQDVTMVKITELSLGGKKISVPEKKVSLDNQEPSVKKPTADKKVASKKSVTKKATAKKATAKKATAKKKTATKKV